ncbi:MAG: PAS domain S-box protein [Firmicutes bacterium]|nr:PAS domain S-box protein [Bacillota bacterium]
MGGIAITTFGALMLGVSILYLYIFFKNHERFMMFWGIAWLIYALGIFSLQLSDMTGSDIFLEIRKMLDMGNILLLLFGTYSFMHSRIPSYWYRFSLYLVILAVICIIYDIELLSFYLPVSAYQLALTTFICINVYTKWNMQLSERITVALIFSAWGASRAVFSILELFMDLSRDFFFVEIILAYTICFCTLAVYISYRKYQGVITDNMYSTIVENSSDVMFSYSLAPVQTFTYVSPSVETLTGYTPNDFYENNHLVHEICVESFAGDIVDIFEGKLRRNDYPAAELYRKNGDKFWCEFQVSLVPDKDGKSATLVGTMRDITAVKTAEVEQVNETRRRNILLSYISHELRTPITSIAGFLTAIQDGTMSSEEEKNDAMDIIVDKTLTMKKLIDDLDQLSKFEANQVTFDYEMLTVGDVTETLIGLNVPDAERDGFEVAVEVDLKSMQNHLLVIDLGRINQVLSNLVNNAVKYSGGSKKLALTFTVDDRGERFMCFVKDDGIGIREEQLPHIFDRFYRVGYNKGADVSGHGLGLTLCKEIIEAHRGDIYAESVYGSGSTFSFTIPLYKED